VSELRTIGYLPSLHAELEIMFAVRFFFLAAASVIGFVHATGGLNGLPVLNGPIPVTPQVLGSKSRVGDFVHPGLWHTHDDLERIRLGVSNGLEPWKSAYANFSLDSFSQSSVSCCWFCPKVVEEKLIVAFGFPVCYARPQERYMPRRMHQLHDLCQ
jgi:hypothetical protein